MVQLSRAVLTGAALTLVVACRNPPPDGGAADEVSADGLRFTMKTLERTLDGCTAGAEGCTYVRFDYPAFVDVPEGVAVEAISEAILSFLSTPLREDEATETPEAVVDSFFESYRELRAAEPDYSHPWFLERKAFVLNNTEDVLCLSLAERAYTGGAHGREIFRYVNLDPETGEPIPLASLFEDGYEAKLLDVAEKRFREVRQVAPEVSLTDAGFTFEGGAFSLSENYAIAEEGLIFHYNPYEVAPYALGPTEIVLPWEELAPILKKPAAS